MRVAKRTRGPWALAARGGWSGPNHRANASGSQSGFAQVLNTQNHGVQVRRLSRSRAQDGRVQTHGGCPPGSGRTPPLHSVQPPRHRARSLAGLSIKHGSVFWSRGPRVRVSPGHSLSDCGPEGLSVAHPCGHFFQRLQLLGVDEAELLDEVVEVLVAGVDVCLGAHLRNAVEVVDVDMHEHAEQP